MDDPLDLFMRLIEEAIGVVNEMEREGVIERYAIGGGAAIALHMEPIPTQDLDVFVFLPQTPGQLILLTPIYDYLKARGHRVGEAWVYIHDIPVQFIPAYDDLTEEAVDRAVDAFCGKTPTRVFRAEHLLAIMLQTSRDKDKERIVRVSQEAAIDERLLEDTLRRHGLWEKWERFWEKRREA